MTEHYVLYSIWLMPCVEQRAMLEETIRRLANRFDTPPFAPHATLCSGVWKKSQAELMDAVGRLQSALSVELSSGGIDWTDHWSTFFFVRLTGAEDLFAFAAEQLNGSHPPSVGPHLSLLYSFGGQSIDRETLRSELAGSLPETIRFDSLAMVRPLTGRWEDVAGWQIRSNWSQQG
jgi:putative hydrolase of the HAD superfamily